jgi:hypothetical protein
MAYQDKLKPIGSTTYQNKLKPLGAVSAPVEDPGFVQSVAQGVANPFLKMFQTGKNIVTGSAGVASSLFNKAIGNDAQAQADLEAASKATAQTGDYGYFGKVSPINTPLQGAGVGFDIASNIPIFKGAKITTDLLKGAIKQGGFQALKSAAVPLAKEGAIAGGMGNFGRGLQEGQSAGDLALNTVGGMAGGAVLGPVLGAVTAPLGSLLGKTTNVGKLFKYEPPVNVKASQKSLDNLASYVRSPLDKIEKAKLKAGKVESGYDGIFSKKTYSLGDEDYAMAQSVKDLVTPGIDKTNSNIAKVLQNVDETYNNDLIPFLDQNPVPHDWNDMRNYLNNKIKPSATLKPGSESYWIFNQIKNKGMEILNNFPKTNRGVQEARSAIDNMINESFGPAIWDINSVQHVGAKDAAIQLRTALNDFTHDSIRFQNMPLLNKIEDFISVAEKRGIKFNTIEDIRLELMKHFGQEVLPENELKAILFRNKLKNINLKLKAVDNMWENAAGEIGKTRLQNIKNPFLKKAITYTATGAGIAATGGYLGSRQTLDNSN